MPHREEILNELEGNTPNLYRIKSDGFEVPEGYFDDLTELVLAKIEQEKLIVPERVERPNFLSNLLDQFAYLLQPRYAAIV
ncbi:MAG: hypothetical protein AAF599_16875, partial [Bacteroidota bacterium]